MMSLIMARRGESRVKKEETRTVVRGNTKSRTNREKKIGQPAASLVKEEPGQCKQSAGPKEGNASQRPSRKTASYLTQELLPPLQDENER